jgi:SAM-dependent methyltransferase
MTKVRLANKAGVPMANEWKNVDHALAYLARADTIPHRTEGETALIDEVSPDSRRILDLGTGDGRLLALLLLHCPEAQGVALDFSPAMIVQASERFHGDDRVRVIEHDLSQPLPDLGTHDAVCSSFAIHHVSDERKRSLYHEIWEILEPGGVFCNLEHVSSPTPRLHRRFLDEIGGEEDASNILLDVETQLVWLREIGFEDVDCLWKWRELALLTGVKPAA